MAVLTERSARGRVSNCVDCAPNTSTAPVLPVQF